MTNNKQRRNTPTGHKDLKKMLQEVKTLIIKNSKIVFPIILIACVAITVVIALNAGKARDTEAEAASTDTTVSDSNVEQVEQQVAVTEEELKNNAYPEVNALIMDYYQAVVNGDVDKVLTISNNVDETEKIRVQELSKYLDSYPSVEIYTKPGPVEGSYLAYVYYQVKFSGYDNTAPGIQTFYICTAEDGTLYMNEGVVDEHITDYIQKVNMHEDVVELFNKVAVEYNDLLVGDPNLGVFLQELNTQMDISVGEALAAAEAEKEAQEAEQEESSEAEGESAEEQESTEAEEQPSGPIRARTTTTINVRSSDSEEADKLGKLQGGTELELLEMRANGWSKIMYEGKEAYVKSDYVAIIEEAEDATGMEAIGTVTAKDTVNVRASASETADKLGVIYLGDTLELIAKQDDGWSKVKYQGQVAYVKSEYVE